MRGTDGERELRESAMSAHIDDDELFYAVEMCINNKDFKSYYALIYSNIL